MRQGNTLLLLLLALLGVTMLIGAWWLRPATPQGLSLNNGELSVPSASPFAVEGTPKPAGPTLGTTSLPPGSVAIPALGISGRIAGDLHVGKFDEWEPPLHDLGIDPGSAALDATAGTVMVAGHVWVGEQPGVLLRLHEVRPGNMVELVDDAGASHHYVVTTARQIPRETLPGGVRGSATGARKLVLITCGGKARWDGAHKVWADNLIVEAVPYEVPR